LIAMVECLRNLACGGATPLAMTDNLNFGNPYKPEAFFQLKECVRGLAEACRFYDVPVVGGNVSLYNESPEGTIDPTPTVSVVGFIEDERYITKQWVKNPGERLVLIGGAPHELGGSQYLGIVHGLKTGDAPQVDLALEGKQNDFLRSEIRAGRVQAAHDLSEGGLLVAAAEMLFARETTFGAALTLDFLGAKRLDALLFGESQGRILVSANPADAVILIRNAAAAGIAAAEIGQITAKPELTVAAGGATSTWDVRDLRHGWETSIETAMRRPGLES
jgi:phosphoribosylformylglycinamidine synthase